MNYVENQSSRYTAVLWLVLLSTLVFMFWGSWWGWPTSFDQHDPTPRAIKMLWDRTFDPGIRYWGGFGYQEVLLFSVIPITALKKILGLDPAFAEALMYLATRMLWALHGTGIVILTYFTSRALFEDNRAALLSAGAVALAPGLVAWAHIAQVDIAHAFWYVLACACAAIGWRRASLRWLWFSAVAAGLAAGVKYIGGVIVLAPMLAVYLRYPKGRATMYAILLMATALVVFFVTTPLASGAPLQWIPEYLADVLANQHREVDSPLAFWTMPGSILDLLGPGISILALAAVLALPLLRGGQTASRGAWLLIASFLVPYYLVLSWQHVATVRYVLPLVSVLAVITGYAASQLLDVPKARKPVIVAMGITTLVQLALVLALLSGFTADTRYRLVEWLNANTREGDVVETLLNHRPYFVSKSAFDTLNRPHFQAETAEMKYRIENDHDSVIRRLLDILTKWMGMEPSSTRTWVDKERDWLKRRVETFDTSPDGPVIRGSRYVVVNRNTAAFYVLDWPGVDPLSPGEKDFFLSVLRETGPFRLRARFDPLAPEWLRHPRELWFNVSPPVEVYEVVNPATGRLDKDRVDAGDRRG